MKTKAKVVPLLPVPDGYYVRIVHHTSPRALDDLATSTHRFVSPRYATNAAVYGPGDQYICDAWAFCNPKDTPSRKAGRGIAHNRAVTKLMRSLLA